MNAPVDGRKQAVQFLIGRWRRPVKTQRPALVFDIHAVEHERVDVHIQIQRRAEALDDRHGPAAAPGGTRPPRATPQEREYGPDEDARDRPA
jgi:hypothetical protein